eukprot:1159329-Pelagomonas_calceolata.AAC.3
MSCSCTALKAIGQLLTHCSLKQSHCSAAHALFKALVSCATTQATSNNPVNKGASIHGHWCSPAYATQLCSQQWRCLGLLHAGSPALEALQAACSAAHAAQQARGAAPARAGAPLCRGRASSRDSGARSCWGKEMCPLR